MKENVSSIKKMINSLIWTDRLQVAKFSECAGKLVKDPDFRVRNVAKKTLDLI